jgi:hypothetical protein
MKHQKHLLIYFLLFISLSGCITPTTTRSRSLNNDTSIQFPTFSKYFEGNSTLVEGRVELFAVAKINWRKPKFEKVNGETNVALVNSDVKIHLHNTTQQHIDFKINSMELVNGEKREYIILEPRNITLIPQTVERLVKEDYTIESTDEEITLNVHYLWNQRQVSSVITLKRLTISELKERKHLPKVF